MFDAAKIAANFARYLQSYVFFSFSYIADYGLLSFDSSKLFDIMLNSQSLYTFHKHQVIVKNLDFLSPKIMRSFNPLIVLYVDCNFSSKDSTKTYVS